MKISASTITTSPSISRAKFRLALYEKKSMVPRIYKSYNDEQLDIKFVDKIKVIF